MVLKKLPMQKVEVTAFTGVSVSRLSTGASCESQFGF